MPSIITHDTFGRDVYNKHYSRIGEGNHEFRAFLLGNQGPDPLFYAFLTPQYLSCRRLGTTFHRQKPSELLAAFKQSLYILNEHERPIGKAYVDGFLCHYLLDSSAHPLVFACQKQLCAAGVDGLDERDKSEVHNLIEAEFDEMILYTRHEETIATFKPAEKILIAHNDVLTILSKMYAYVAMMVYQEFIPKEMFGRCVKNYRSMQRVYHSRTGIKRTALSKAEELFRRHSLYRCISLRDIKLTESQFDNHERSEWENPFTEQKSTKSFQDIYAQSLINITYVLELFSDDEISVETARQITRDLNFSGDPTQPILITAD